jgi:hypothetical protein
MALLLMRCNAQDMAGRYIIVVELGYHGGDAFWSMANEEGELIYRINNAFT